MAGVYHAGESAVQVRAGVCEMAARIGKGIRATIPPAADEFLRRQVLVVVASVDSAGGVWASPLSGEPGFAHSLDERTLVLEGVPDSDDPLAGALCPGVALGLIAIEPATRRRLRVNGVLGLVASDRLHLRTEQVYSNCPKYIQARELRREPAGGPATGAARHADALDARQQAWIAAADTFFIATIHTHAGVDASHRGGMPGFVRVESPTRLVFPDYAGNTMFQTLGNIAADPRAGLLFLDFERGDTVQLTGQARILWEPEEIAPFAGAARAVAVDITAVVDRCEALSLRAYGVEYSPFNPRPLATAVLGARSPQKETY